MASKIPKYKQKADDDERRTIDPRWHTEASLAWKCYDWQRPAYDLLPQYGALRSSDQREFVLLAHRDFGKSHILCTKVLETAKNNEGLSINIFAGTAKQARAIFSPKFSKIAADAPTEFMPKYSTADEFYSMNKCSISVIGGTTGTADNQRGRDYDFAVFDEPMMIPEIEYLYTSVVLPRILTGTGVAVWISSAPKTPAHFFAKKIERARKANYLHTFTIRENPRFTADDVKRIADEMGGEDSTTFRREMMCEVMTDENVAVFPELIKNKTYLSPQTVDEMALHDLPLYCALSYSDTGKKSLISFNVAEEKVIIRSCLEVNNIPPHILSRILREDGYLTFGKKYSAILSNLKEKDARSLSRVLSLPIFPTDTPDNIDRVKFARSLLSSGRVIFSENTTALRENLSDAIYDDAKRDFLPNLFSLTTAFTVLAERHPMATSQDMGVRKRLPTDGSEYFF